LLSDDKSKDYIFLSYPLTGKTGADNGKYGAVPDT
jgi:hypothetical protein